MESTSLVKKARSVITEYEVIKRTLDIAKDKHKQESVSIGHIRDAKAFLTQFIESEHQAAKNIIETIVQQCLDAVCGEGMRFELIFCEKRKMPAIDMVVHTENGMMSVRPQDDDLGGGEIDTVSFGLRFALWLISVARKGNTFILDEPFKYLDISPERSARLASFIKEVSRSFGIQMIIVTHSPALIAAADRIFEVSKRNGKSEVKVVPHAQAGDSNE